MSGEYLDSEFYTESSYTADISNKMRVPDRYTIIHFYFTGFDKEEEIQSFQYGWIKFTIETKSYQNLVLSNASI